MGRVSGTEAEPARISFVRCSWRAHADAHMDGPSLHSSHKAQITELNTQLCARGAEKMDGKCRGQEKDSAKKISITAFHTRKKKKITPMVQQLLMAKAQRPVQCKQSRHLKRIIQIRTRTKHVLHGR